MIERIKEWLKKCVETMIARGRIMGGRFAKRPYLGTQKHKKDNEYMQIFGFWVDAGWTFGKTPLLVLRCISKIASVTNKGKKIGCACGAPYGVF